MATLNAECEILIQHSEICCLVVVLENFAYDKGFPIVKNW
jgi:hypothetical protein